MYDKRLASFGVLAALPRVSDQSSVRKILSYYAWKLVVARKFSEAVRALPNPRVSVVLCDEAFPSGESWRDVLAETCHLTASPPLIVCSRCVTDNLFAEVVGSGGFDVLQLPIRKPDFVTRVMNAMLFHRRHSRIPRF